MTSSKANKLKTPAMKMALPILIVLTACSFLYSQESRVTANRSKHEGSSQIRRVALVIGNGTYNLFPLRSPVTDATDMGQALVNLGFDVTCKTNLNQNEMKQAIKAFGESIKPGVAGLFYYAGHAVQVNGRNYLVPIGAQINNEIEVEYETVDAGFVLLQMQKGRGSSNIIILDASRSNPFRQKFRSTNDGLAPINAPSGTLIAYATAPGYIAIDGEGRNGLYAQELLKAMREPALKIEDVFKRVRGSVRNLTAGKQVTWESSSLVEDFYFFPDKGGPNELQKREGWPNASIVPPPAVETTSNRSLLSKTAADVFINQGDTAAKQKRWAEAENEYKQAVDLDPVNARLRRKLGDMLSQQKKWDEAEAQYLAAVQIEPQNKTYQNCLTAARNRTR